VSSAGGGRAAGPASGGSPAGGVASIGAPSRAQTGVHDGGSQQRQLPRALQSLADSLQEFSIAEILLTLLLMSVADPNHGTRSEEREEAAGFLAGLALANHFGRATEDAALSFGSAAGYSTSSGQPSSVGAIVDLQA
jgi:hypothetical protein